MATRFPASLTSTNCHSVKLCRRIPLSVYLTGLLILFAVTAITSPFLTHWRGRIVTNAASAGLRPRPRTCIRRTPAGGALRTGADAGTWTAGGIANVAHLGGALFGYLYLKLIPRRGLASTSSRRPFRSRARLLAGSIFVQQPLSPDMRSQLALCLSH